MASDAELVQARDVATITAVLDMTTRMSFPDTCSICLEENRPFMLSICGDGRHGLCVHCVAQVCARRLPLSVHGDSPLFFRNSHYVHERVECPSCRQGAYYYAPPLLEPSVDELKTCEFKDPFTVLPGVWLNVYSEPRVKELNEWKRALPQTPFELPDGRQVSIDTVSQYLQPRLASRKCPFDRSDDFKHRNIAKHCDLPVHTNIEGMQRHLRVCIWRPVVCPYCSLTFPVALGSHNHVQYYCTNVKCNQRQCTVTGSWEQVKDHIKEHNALVPEQDSFSLYRAFSQARFLDDLGILREALRDPVRVRELLQRAPNHRLPAVIQAQTAIHAALSEMAVYHYPRPPVAANPGEDDDVAEPLPDYEDVVQE